MHKMCLFGTFTPWQWGWCEGCAVHLQWRVKIGSQPFLSPTGPTWWLLQSPEANLFFCLLLYYFFFNIGHCSQPTISGLQLGSCHWFLWVRVRFGDWPKFQNSRGHIYRDKLPVPAFLSQEHQGLTVGIKMGKKCPPGQSFFLSVASN